MKDYDEDDIRALSLREAVKMRPDVHFNECFEQGSLNRLPFEFLCHALDEYFDGRQVKIAITLEGSSFLIRYNCGISLQETPWGMTKAESIMMHLMVCRNGKKHLAVGEKYCRIGIAVLNNASSWCVLETASDGKLGKFRFEEGKTVSREIVPYDGEEFTTLEVLPDPGIFNGLTLDPEGLKALAKELKAELKGLEITVS